MIQNLKETDLCFRNDMKNLVNFHRLKNRDVILEIEMAELNQNIYPKQPDRPDAVWKLYFTLEINEWTINKTFYTCSAKSLFLLRNKKVSKKAVKLASFLQCSLHIFLELDGGFWKINLKILWKHIMKNFHVKHGQCERITFTFDKKITYLDTQLKGQLSDLFWKLPGGSLFPHSE